MKPWLVLCMAGRYGRFRSAGYITPKYLLPLDGRPVLTSVIEALGPDRLLLVANERDATFEGPIRDAVRAAGVDDYTLLFTADTIGQAQTAAIGARRLVEEGWNGPVLFHSADTIVRGRDLAHMGFLLEMAEGFVDVYQTSGARTYVALDGDRVKALADRVAISQHAATGLSGFRSPASYLDAADATAGRSRGEFHLSDVYLLLLERGGEVRADPSGDGHETLVLGTPAEYERAVELSARSRPAAAGADASRVASQRQPEAEIGSTVDVRGRSA